MDKSYLVVDETTGEVVKKIDVIPQASYEVGMKKWGSVFLLALGVVSNFITVIAADFIFGTAESLSYLASVVYVFLLITAFCVITDTERSYMKRIRDLENANYELGKKQERMVKMQEDIGYWMKRADAAEEKLRGQED